MEMAIFMRHTKLGDTEILEDGLQHMTAYSIMSSSMDQTQGILSPIHPPLKDLLNRMISLEEEMDQNAVKAGPITIVPGRDGS
ncbi:hypothetical protein NEOLI_000698 [Neolecta irregularis DAH-3]|uniref:Uncharacterized protein n=1 Tax=Neolecta irregularis (strain DAH-3) TaxID=1198029 RepID=A0A1U7LWH0_NEOID|nr:hypothetical protein NEOLI_000698 [Neolecta irregularis DAH-3]|eukprot:OLL26892.1 hypothetical protein NEOLI_000698 [Neolecta irregularis DAH-3]